MGYIQFVEWIEQNTPDGEDSEVLIEFLASLSAELVDEGAKRNNVSSKHFLTTFLASKFDAFTRH